MKLTDTQRAILAAAAEHPEHLAYPPERLPAAARQTVAKALLKNDLVIGVHRPAYDAIAKWTVDGDEMLLKITDDGLRAIGVDPNAGEAPEEDEQSAEAIARRNAESRAAAEAAAIRDRATDELRGEIARLATLAAERIVRESLDDRGHAALIDGFAGRVREAAGAGS